MDMNSPLLNTESQSNRITQLGLASFETANQKHSPDGGSAEVKALDRMGELISSASQPAPADRATNKDHKTMLGCRMSPPSKCELEGKEEKQKERKEEEEERDKGKGKEKEKEFLGDKLRNKSVPSNESESRISERKVTVPKRKLSVFSFNGFPNVQQLDQQNLKSRLALTQSEVERNQQIQMLQGRQNQQLTSQPLSIAGDRNAHISNLPTATGQNIAEPNKTRRSMRSDTLGSTGSSRASSCDEPTIAVPSLNSSGFSSLTSSISGHASLPNQPQVGSAGGSDSNAINARRKISSTLQGEISNSSNLSSSHQSSSMESITSWTSASSETATPKLATEKYLLESESSSAHTDQSLAHLSSLAAAAATTTKTTPTPTPTTTNAAPPDSAAKKPPTVPPFESIRTQLKPNSNLDHHQIQRHIEKVISQNEAIMDNWNLVSIRSYNSARDQATNLTAPQTATTCQPLKRVSSDLLCNQAETRDHQQLVASNKPPNKRWSTTVLPNTSNLMLASAGSTMSDDSKIGPSPGGPIYSNSSTNQQQQQQQQQQLVRASKLRQAERKRSYNLSKHRTSLAFPLNPIIFAPAKRGSSPKRIPTELNGHQSFLPQALAGAALELTAPTKAHHAHPQCSPVNSACEQQFATATTSISTSQDIHKYLTSKPRPIQGCSMGNLNHSDPVQLENAIQNLSLKRKEETLEADIVQCQQAHLLFNAPAINGNNSNRNTNENHITLTCNQEQQEEENLRLSQQRESIMAALIMEQQRQISLDNAQAAAILRQKQHERQIIEQQFEKLRLNQMAASLEQQRQIEDQRQLALAANQLPAFLTAPLQLHQLQLQQQQQQQQASNLADQLSEHQAIETNLLEDFLAQVMPRRGCSPRLISEELRFRRHSSMQLMHNLEHGSEMLTQSLDSATPTHRCEACDISFWTGELLNYHRLTQCRARAPDQLSQPIAFRFDGPNNFDDLQPRRENRCSPASKLDPLSEISKRLPNEANSMADSILKQQLLALQKSPVSFSATKMVNRHESLPFKKRKVSEPNMRY